MRRSLHDRIPCLGDGSGQSVLERVVENPALGCPRFDSGVEDLQPEGINRGAANLPSRKRGAEAARETEVVLEPLDEFRHGETEAFVRKAGEQDRGERTLVREVPPLTTIENVSIGESAGVICGEEQADPGP